jgi:hypothetical protein
LLEYSFPLLLGFNTAAEVECILPRRILAIGRSSSVTAGILGLGLRSSFYLLVYLFDIIDVLAFFKGTSRDWLGQISHLFPIAL